MGAENGEHRYWDCIFMFSPFYFYAILNVLVIILQYDRNLKVACASDNRIYRVFLLINNMLDAAAGLAPCTN